MRKMVIAIAFPVIGHAQSCPMVFDDVNNTPAPVLTPAPLFSGSGGVICIGMRRCTYNLASLPPAEFIVSNQDILVRKRVLDENLDPGFCASSTYLRVSLPPLQHGSYSVRYELVAADQFGVDVSFARTGTITVGPAPSPVPTLAFPSIVALLAGIGLIGIKRSRA